MSSIKQTLFLAACMCVLKCTAQLNVKALIEHTDFNPGDTLGKITIEAAGGFPPYSYEWLSTGITTKDILDIPKGSYAVKVTDLFGENTTYYYDLGHKVEWNTVSDNSIISKNILRPNVSGWAQIIAGNYAGDYFAGFLENDTQSGINDFMFALYISDGNAIYTWAGGEFVFHGYAAEGDVFKLGRNTDGFYLSKNNQIVTVHDDYDPAQNIRLKVQTETDLFLDIGCSFVDFDSGLPLMVNATVDHLRPGGADYTGNINLSVSGGSSPYAFEWLPNNSVNKNNTHVPLGLYTLSITDYNNESLLYHYNLGYKSTWSNFNGTSVINDKLVISGGPVQGNPTAVTKNILKSDTEGWLEVVMSDFLSPYAIGFIDTQAPEIIGSLDDMECGFYIGDGNALYLVSDGDLTFLQFINQGDVVQIARTSSGEYNLSVNDNILSSGVSEFAKNLKVKAYITSDLKVNVGCSFSTSFFAQVQKKHASPDNLYSGAAGLFPQGSSEPYTITWDDGEVSSTKSDLFPGNYTARAWNAEHTEELTKVIDIGVEPLWRIRQNILYQPDSIKLSNADQLGALVSYNTSFNNEEAWFEMKMSSTTGDLCFGFIGNEKVNMDTTVLPPSFSEDILTTQLNRIKELFDEAIEDNLLYTDGKLNMGLTYKNLFFVRVHNGKIISLINGSNATEYNFAVGDILKIGRKYTGQVYFKINETEMFLRGDMNISDRFLLSSVVLKSASSSLEQIGIYTDATPESYRYRLSRTPICIQEICQNWTLNRTFDEFGNVASEAKQYYDTFGRPTQSQKKLLSENNVIASEVFYDSHGRTAGETLPAPMYTSGFCNSSVFFSNSSNQHYSLNDFDKSNTTNNVSGEKYNPAAVGNTIKGTLGWYYSNNNNDNAYVPADAYPYSRVEYSDDPLSRVTRKSSVGRFHKLGSNRETKIYYMNGGAELKMAYKKISSSQQIHTYELNDNFQALTYNAFLNYNILNAHKTVVVNSDGHDEISYTSSSGKLLATCTSGYDPDGCSTVEVSNEISTNSAKAVLIHIPKEDNGSLRMENTLGTSHNVNYCNPHLRLYTTKYLLILNTDYTYNTTTGAVTFLGEFATMDLFLEVSYGLLVLQGNPVPGYPLTFRETHKVGYTNWTVYYYDVKGRLKAYVSPNEFSCQPLSRSVVVSNNNPIAFPCNKSTIVSSTSLDGAMQEPTDRLDVKLEFEPKVNFFTNFKTNLTSDDFQLQSCDTLAPKDSIYIFESERSANPDSIPVIMDTTAVTYYNDSLYNANNEALLDSVFKLLDGKSIRYEGNYLVGKRFSDGTSQFFTERPLHFNYSLSIHDRKAEFVNNLPGEKLSFYLDSAEIRGASNIVVKCDNLKIQLQDFNSAPVTLFDPCDLSLYVGPTSAKLITSLNANIGLATTAQIWAAPAPPQPQPGGTTPMYSKKFYYNEYDHLVATETPDEGRVDYLYDLKEDKLLFTQDDKQRATGGKFNYISYDDKGRPVERGEYDPQISNGATNYQFQTYNQFMNQVQPNTGFTSLGTLITGAQNIPFSSRCIEVTHIEYDLPNANSGITQQYLNAKASSMSNDNHNIFYSYNERGQLVKSVENATGLTDKTMEYEYDFFGNLKRTVYQRSASDEYIQVYTRDADQRLSATSFQPPPNGQSSVMQPATEYKYYLHGPVKRTVLGNNLQGLDYVYTLNGSLKSVNNPQTSADPGLDGTPSSNVPMTDIFRYTLDYYPNDYERSGTQMAITYNTASFGQGNISYSGQVRAMRWNQDIFAPPSGFSAGPYMYEYNYDELYRLKDAKYGTCSSGSGVITFAAGNAFKLENITYDRNGNIKTLKRYANVSSGNPVLMDDLTYNYNSAKRNRLQNVTDNITSSLGLSPEINFPNQASSGNYQYSQTGQMGGNIADNQKYEYNSRGLVTTIKSQANVLISELKYNVFNKRSHKYTYDVNGTLVSLVCYVYDAFGREVSTYEQTSFSSPTDAPAIRDFNINGMNRAGMFEVSGYRPLFEITDHLGNIRVVVTNAPTFAQAIVQLCDYYPHGGPLPGSGYSSGPSYRYGYQGKEKDPETRLTNFDLRQMDPRLGRWLNADPMHQHHSPYLAMNNNPVSSIDPSGGYDYPINYYDCRTGKSTNDKNYANGIDISWVHGTANNGQSLRNQAHMLAAQGEAAADASAERQRWHHEKEARGIRMSNYFSYLRAHQNNEGEWGSYAYYVQWHYQGSNEVEEYAETGGAKKVVFATFTADASWKIDRPENPAGYNMEGLNPKYHKNVQNSEGGRNGTTASAITIALPNIGDIPLIGNSPLVKALSIFSMIDKSFTNAINEKFSPKGKVRPLTKGEIKMMQNNGVDPHDLKPEQGNGKKIDLYRDTAGDIFYRIEGSKNYTHTFENWYNIVMPK